MRRPASRLTLTLVLWAWLAQLCLPVVHAAAMAQPHAKMLGWCGDPAQIRALMAELPTEMRLAIDPNGEPGAEHLAGCARLCATGSTPAPVLSVANAVGLPPAALELAPTVRASAVSRKQAPKPPAQGPPAQA